MPNPYATLADIAAAQRIARANATRHPFSGCIGGSFKPRTFDAGDPSLRALDAAAERIARDQRDADAIRNSHAAYRNRTGTYC